MKGTFELPNIQLTCEGPTRLRCRNPCQEATEAHLAPCKATPQGHSQASQVRQLARESVHLPSRWARDVGALRGDMKSTTTTQLLEGEWTESFQHLFFNQGALRVDLHMQACLIQVNRRLHGT